MSKKQNKYAFFGKGVNDLSSEIINNHINKYYNLWMSKFKWKGLDEEQSSVQQNYIMRKLWCDGTVAVRKVNNLDMLVFAPWVMSKIGMYDLPEAVQLVNLYGTSTALIPQTPLTVNKDVVLLWAMPNHKPVRTIVQYYCERLAQVEMVINTNLQLQKMPWLIGVDETDEDKMKDIVDRIINNEVVVFASLEDLAKVQTLATQTPYIIDKLSDYKFSIEQELLTVLGIDNNGNSNLEKTHITADAVNANNDIINDFATAVEDEIKRSLEDVKRVLGRTITIEKSRADTATAVSLHDGSEKAEVKEKRGDNNE